MLVIELELSTMKLSFLTLWEIPKEYPSLLDHKLIFIYWDNASYNLSEKKVVESHGWDLRSLIRLANDLKLAHINWIEQTKDHIFLDLNSNCKNLDKEVE